MRYDKLRITFLILMTLSMASVFAAGCGGGNGVGIGTTLWWLDKNESDNSTTEVIIAGPAFVSAVADSTGTKLSLTFDKGLKPEGLAAGDFSVRTNNSATIEVTMVRLNSDPKIVELTLAKPVICGQPVSVAYSKGTAVGSNGKLLDSFVPMAVINNVLSGDIEAGQYTLTSTAPAADGQIQYVAGTTAVIVARSTGENLIYNNGANFNALKSSLAVSANGLTAGDKITVANGGVTAVEVSGMNIGGAERTFSLSAATLKIGQVEQQKKLIIAGDNSGNIVIENSASPYGDVIITGSKNGDLTITGGANVTIGQGLASGNILGATKLNLNNSSFRPSLTVTGTGTLSGQLTLSAGYFTMQNNAVAANGPIIVNGYIDYISIGATSTVAGFTFTGNCQATSFNLGKSVPIDITNVASSSQETVRLSASEDIAELVVTQQDTAPRLITGNLGTERAPFGYGMISWSMGATSAAGNSVAYSISAGENKIRLSSLLKWSTLSMGKYNGWVGLSQSGNCKVYSMAFDGTENLYLGGNFTQSGANNIAKWNGSSWSALGSGLDNTCRKIVMDGSGNLYAGGSFTQAGGAAANNIAKWDGTSWAALGTGLDSICYSLTFDGGNIYAGGNFNLAGGVTARGVARWNGSSWSALGNGPKFQSDDAIAVFADGGKIYAGGRGADSFNAVSGYSVWDGSNWGGAYVFGTVQDIAIDKIRRIIYCGGDLKLYSNSTYGVTQNFY